ncbi:non-ribosomal peptide synthetase [Nocardia panacis]|uniref:non-ribosomal peptide synthetase n=1 Tax=Nocardia panacis TaxID=2340916 RepID=UPI0013155F43|nr:non-ribosomal peptide synthetase [Nocardia panacis]
MKSVIGEAYSVSVARRRSASGRRAATLATLLAWAAEHNPDGIAVREGERALSYRELDARSSQLARVLLARGAGPETMVAVALPRSLSSIVAVWAVAKSGAAFVPLDPGFPAARLAFHLADANIALGVTDRGSRAALPDTATWLVVDEPETVAAMDLASADPIWYRDRPVSLRVSNIAYLIYTSGSTGMPKGVAVTHAGLGALCGELRSRYGVTAESHVLHCASPSFDAAILELLLAVGASATLVIAPREVFGGAELAELLVGQGVTHAFLTPSVLATVEPAGLAALRVLLVGGEACPPGLVPRWATGGRYFGNAYGPTESTIAATLSGPLDGERVTIGAPVPETRCRVLDARLRPVGAGVAGELYICGPAIARGYHGRPGLTALRFLPDPYGPPGSRVYRSGDLVRLDADGELEYRGRTDDQVQIRGVRIELGEINAVLTAQPGVRLAVTVDRESASGAPTLLSFVQPEPDQHPQVCDLTAALAAALPAYLRPSSIVVLERIPLTPTGKVDRQALRAHRETPCEYLPPTDPGQAMVAAAFAEVLGQRPGADADFFASGGNSLLATRAAVLLGRSWGARIPVRLIFDHPTVAGLAAALKAGRFDALRLPLQAQDRPERIPLSPAQLRFWLRNRFDTVSSVDNIGFALRLSDLDVPALRAALLDTVTRHEALRTRYPADADGPFQLIIDPDRLADEFAVEEVAAAAVVERVHAVLRRGFDVAEQIPLRVRLLRTGPNYILVCAMHHICADGSSLAPLARDVGIAYAARCAGTAPEWIPTQVQYADYALWQRDLLGAREDPDSLLSRQLDYWTTELAGLPDELDLPADRPRPATASLRGAGVEGTVSSELHAGLLALAGARRATLFMVMRTALAVLLARLSGATDIAIGVPMTNRDEPALVDVVGMFVNTTVSRTAIDPRESFAALLDRTRERDLANFANSDVPFEHVVDAVNPVRSPGRHPLYQVGFAFQNFARARLELTGSHLAMVDVDADTVKTDLHIGVSELPGADEPAEILVRFGYSTDLFDADTVRRFIAGYLRVLEQVAADPAIAVGDLDLLDAPQRRQLETWSAGPEFTASNGRLTDAIGTWAARTPDAVAVRCGAAVLTYAQLCDRGNRLARWLIRQGVGPETVVAVAMRRSVAQVLALYAISAAGGAWVPLDPTHPAERNGYVLDSARALCVLTVRADAALVPGAHAIDTLDLAPFDASPIGDAERTAPLRGGHPAYVIYTSGSTGRPKGVVVEHDAIVNQLDWMARHYGVTAEDVYLQKTPATFDVALWGYFLPLRAGGRLILAGPDDHRDPRALGRAIGRHGVTLTDFVPSMLTVFASAAFSTELASLRAIFVIGEALPPETVAAFAGVGGARVHNLYGPTEAAVSITGYMVPAATAARVPIGMPQGNSVCHVLDARLRPVPLGAVGELYLGGVQLARGYHGAPGRTADRFVADPCGGGRMYRTGDLVRWTTEGALDYLGRTDFQVKVRGHRIELGEIETALLADPAVAQAAVAVKPSAVGDRLVAYAVAVPGVVLDPDAVRQGVSRILPGYMVPAAVVVLAALPVNTSGKLDRSALPEPIFAARATIAPSTELERVVAEVFGEVLDVAVVGATDDFYELGGSSLLAFTLCQRLSVRLRREVPLSALLGSPTVGGIAGYLCGAATRVEPATPGPDAVLDPDIDPTVCAPVRGGAFGDVLLTGGTGFLGAHLLDELLTRTDARIRCLVRACDETEGLARIQRALHRFRLSEAAADRVAIVLGDLVEPRLGLSEHGYAELVESVDAIYHCGARVNHVDPYPRLRAANVEGTRELLRLATTHRAKAFHFISTIGASVPNTPITGEIDEDTHLRADQVQDNGYIASKWAAEELVRQAAARGLPATIYRPGTLCGDLERGVNSEDDSFWNMIRAAATLGMAPDVGDASMALVPVGYVARAIVAIATDDPTCAAYHLVTPAPTSVAAVFAALREHGYPIETVDLDTARTRLEQESAGRAAAGDDSSIRAALLSRTAAALAGHFDWSDTNVRKALAGTDIECPAIDRAALDRYIAQFAATGFLPAPVAVAPS